MEDYRSAVSQDIMRSFRRNLGQEVTFMCLYMTENVGGVITNERLFTGKELVELFSSVISSNEDLMLPTIMYSLFNLYGPIRVFDICKDYSKGFEMKTPFNFDGGSGTTVPPVPDN